MSVYLAMRETESAVHCQSSKPDQLGIEDVRHQDSGGHPDKLSSYYTGTLCRVNVFRRSGNAPR